MKKGSAHGSIRRRGRSGPVKGRRARDATKENESGHPSREELFLLIEEQPGLNIQELVENSGVARSTTRHHVRRLVDDGRVVTRRQGHHLLHFSSKMPEMQRAAVSLLRVGSVRCVVEAALEDPYIDVDKIAQPGGYTTRSVRRSIRMLTKEGLAVSKPSSENGKKRSVLWLHNQLRIAWALWCEQAEGGASPGSLWKAPGWLFGLEMMMGQMLAGMPGNS